MTNPQHGVSPPVAVAFSTIGFFALLIAGFGMLSLLADADVLGVPGLGQLPGVVGTAAAALAFAATAWVAVHRPRPAYASVVVIVLAAFLAYLLGLLVGAVMAGVDAARAVAAVGGFATGWFALVLASAALIAGWSAIALVRTRAGRPLWPWERDEP